MGLLCFLMRLIWMNEVNSFIQTNQSKRKHVSDKNKIYCKTKIDIVEEQKLVFSCNRSNRKHNPSYKKLILIKNVLLEHTIH